MEDEEVAESWEEAADSGVRNTYRFTRLAEKQGYNPISVCQSNDHLARIHDALDVSSA